MRKLTLLASVAVSLLLAGCAKEQKETLSVIPVPLSADLQKGAFQLNDQTKLWIDAPQEDKTRLADYIAGSPFQLDAALEEVVDNVVILQQVDRLPDITSSEGYVLEVTPKQVKIRAASGAGLFYGVQTFLQMVNEKKELPVGTVTDEPRFAYRGMMLDVSRHFFDVNFVKKQIDAFAYYKLNRLHLHLTDAAGWRIEIDKYPRLTEFAAWREFPTWKEWWNNGRQYSEEGSENAYGGYYTKEDIRELVAYAESRYITVIPEIEMPAHSEEVLTAYPELSCTHEPYKQADFCVGNEKTFEFLENVLTEVMELFPSEYIHIGGDEAGKASWPTCKLCQARMKKEGLKDVNELQSYLIHRIEVFLNGHNRKLLGWDEILEGGLAPNATVMSWRGTEGGMKAVESGHKAIMTPGEFCYFDSYQDAPDSQPEAIGGYLPLSKVYSFNPVPDTLSAEKVGLVYGVQANLFTEYIPTPEHAEMMIYPRVLALAEVAWSAPSKKNYEDFLKRLPGLVDVYDVYKYNYATHVFDVNAVFTPNPQDGTLDVTLSTIDNCPIYYTLDGSEPTAASAQYTEPLKLKENCTFQAVAVRPTGNSRIVKEDIAFNKASMKPVTMLQPVNKQYEFNGAPTLVDGLKGNGNYKTGRWIAFYKNDMEAVIDLKEPTEIQSASISTCVEKGDWVFDARALSVAVSEDGQNFKEVASEKYPAMKQDDKNGVFNHTLTFSPVTARYVKVTALTEHSIPAWHGGKGNPAFLFVDEISLN